VRRRPCLASCVSQVLCLTQSRGNAPRRSSTEVRRPRQRRPTSWLACAKLSRCRWPPCQAWEVGTRWSSPRHPLRRASNKVDGWPTRRLTPPCAPPRKVKSLSCTRWGLCKADGQALAPGQPCPQLAPAFAGVPLDAQYFALLRDIFPAAKALSEENLLAATQAARQGMFDEP
jgi:hypothetical protein